jgi:hypothetical protein
MGVWCVTLPRFALRIGSLSMVSGNGPEWMRKVTGHGGWFGAQAERSAPARTARDQVVVNAQASWLAWEDGTKSLQWQNEARRWWWWEDGCSDYRAGVCESEWAEDGGEDGISLGVVCRADYLQDVLRTLPSGVWGEWVRHPFAAVSGVPGGCGRGGAAGGGAGIIRVRSCGPARGFACGDR